MNDWWLMYLLMTTTWSLVKPFCFLCSQNCVMLPQAKVNISSKIYVKCESNYDPNLEVFFQRNNFNQTESLTLLSGQMKNLNLTKIQNIPHLNFSFNKLTSIPLKTFNQTVILNLSHNSINDIGELPSIPKLDLSFNRIEILNASFVKNSTKLTYLMLQNNIIFSIENVSSNTLQYLNLANNEIKKLDLGFCENMKELDLSNNSIEVVNVNISQNLPKIQILNISFNFLERLIDYNFNFTNLLKLDLKRNRIQYISQMCFFGLNKLQYLNIASNRIQTISPNTFHYLPGLIQLIISNNSELMIPDFSLMLASGRLKTLDASRTNQNKIPSSLTRSILYLHLASNNLHQIQSGDLDSYPLLNSLDLSNSNLSFIEDDALGRLELLTVLNLNQNSLVNVPHTLPNNLNILLLRQNKIRVITSNDFVGLQQLTQLDLSLNEIQELNETSFTQLYSLERLNLSGNPIKVLSSNSFTGLKNLKVLDLSFLLKLNKCEQTLCFPVPEYNNLRELNMKNSSILVQRFINDVAALKTFRQLISLNLANSNLTSVKKDLATHLPRLNYLHLGGNSINCSNIRKIFLWYYIRELSECVFFLSEKHFKVRTYPKEAKQMTRLSSNIQKIVYSSSFTTPSTRTNTLSTELIKATENKTVILNVTIENKGVSNDLWYSERVDAFSSDTPTSHPSLFILLLLPIILISTCLVLNYSRLNRTQNYNKKCEMDIEIANISSDLW